MQPKLVGIKGGWAAVGKGWAVFGETKEQALQNFVAAESRHATIAMRDKEATDGRDTKKETAA